jgi:arylsulfatase A
MNLAIPLLLLATAAAPLAAPVQPHIVLFVADDLGHGDLGCYNNPDIRTPHLDAFARQGARLTQCYAGSAVCSPARAALLTGRTPHRSGVYTWLAEGSPVHLRTSEITVAEILRDSGYNTCHSGKWHLNGRFNDRSQPQPGDHGYEWWFATQNNAAPSHENPENYVRNGTAVGRIEGYSASIAVNEAIGWLKHRRDPDKPFFLTLWTHEPHYPIQSAPRFRALYQNVADETLREYRANVSQMDDAFGTLMQALREQGLADHTFVFFTSDNGPEGDGVTTPGRGSTGGLNGRKRDLLEGGIRVPGLARWPGHIPPGSTVAAPVTGCDFLPTALAVAGIAPPAGRPLDGVDVSPVLTGKAAAITRPQPLFWRLDMAPVYQFALRDGDWKLLASHKFTHSVLYNLAADPGETTDLKKREPARFAAMRDQLIRHNEAIAADAAAWPGNLDPNGATPRRRP